ncbi:MAG: hypothetical protein ACI8W7_002104 [Gammaproteobacteria bacterium]|jgi:hypothetical protein
MVNDGVLRSRAFSDAEMSSASAENDANCRLDEFRALFIGSAKPIMLRRGLR